MVNTLKPEQNIKVYLGSGVSELQAWIDLLTGIGVSDTYFHHAL